MHLSTVLTSIVNEGSFDPCPKQLLRYDSYIQEWWSKSIEQAWEEFSQEHKCALIEFIGTGGRFDINGHRGPRFFKIEELKWWTKVYRLGLNNFVSENIWYRYEYYMKLVEKYQIETNAEFMSALIGMKRIPILRKLGIYYKNPIRAGYIPNKDYVQLLKGRNPKGLRYIAITDRIRAHKLVETLLSRATKKHLVSDKVLIVDKVLLHFVQKDFFMFNDWWTETKFTETNTFYQKILLRKQNKLGCLFNCPINEKIGNILYEYYHLLDGKFILNGKCSVDDDEYSCYPYDRSKVVATTQGYIKWESGKLFQIHYSNQGNVKWEEIPTKTLSNGYIAAKIWKITFVFPIRGQNDHAEGNSVKDAVSKLTARQLAAAKKYSLLEGKGGEISLSEIKDSFGYCLPGTKQWCEKHTPHIYHLLKDFHRWSDVPETILNIDWGIAEGLKLKA